MPYAPGRHPAPWLFGVTALPYGVYGYKRFGVRGLKGVDCLAGVVAVAIFLLLIRRTLFKTKPPLVVSSVL